MLMRPRWYGSTEIQSMRTSTSPGPGSGTGCSTSAKSVSGGTPVGRAASVTARRFYLNRHVPPFSNSFRIRRLTTMRCTSSGPS